MEDCIAVWYPDSTYGQPSPIESSCLELRRGWRAADFCDREHGGGTIGAATHAILGGRLSHDWRRYAAWRQDASALLGSLLPRRFDRPCLGRDRHRSPHEV